MARFILYAALALAMAALAAVAILTGRESVDERCDRRARISDYIRCI